MAVRPSRRMPFNCAWRPVGRRPGAGMTGLAIPVYGNAPEVNYVVYYLVDIVKDSQTGKMIAWRIAHSSQNRA